MPAAPLNARQTATVRRAVAPRRRPAHRCAWLSGVVTPTHSALTRCPCDSTHVITIDGAEVGRVCPAHAAAAAAHFWQVAPAAPRRSA